jgi:PII-like signaling protein
MDGCYLRLYVHENTRVGARLAWEWILEQANDLGIRGGSAFRAMAGFGRHHVLHEERFFELAGSVTVELDFIVTDEEARLLLDLLEREQLRVFYARVPAHFGVVGGPSPG